MVLIAASGVLLAGTYVAGKTNIPPVVTIGSEGFTSVLVSDRFQVADIVLILAQFIGILATAITYLLSWHNRRQNKPTTTQRRILLAVAFAILLVGMPATAVRYKTQVDGYARIEEADAARICRTGALKEACTRAGGFLTVATLGFRATRFMPRGRKDQRPE